MANTSRFTEHLSAYRAHMALVAQFLSSGGPKRTEADARRAAEALRLKRAVDGVRK